MLTKIHSAAVQGIDALPITIETLVDKGIGYTIVGLPDTAVRESYQRMAAAMQSTGIDFTMARKRIVINLAPASVRKGGAGYDLPMLLGILSAAGVIPADSVQGVMSIGELSLSGDVLGVSGVLPMAIKAREMGLKRLIVPEANATEAAIVNNIDVYGISSLAQAVALLLGRDDAPSPTVVDTRARFAQSAGHFDADFADVRGQELVKRAIEVACAGGHNLLLVGPPGSGKSMMAKCIPSVLPPLTLGEALETTKIHSVAGAMPPGSTLLTQRPFRSPHHTLSPVAMVGGGTSPMPGEISMAHHGVLYFDEFPEFPRAVLEVLRQPVEDRRVTISRSAYTVSYPASFMLVASMNPCPCGYYNHPTRPCTCAPGDVQRYLKRLSGPLLDRIDLHVETLPVEIDALASRKPGEPSAVIRARVIAARQRQTERFRDEEGVYCNAQMNARQLRRHAWPDERALDRLKRAMDRNGMSARAFSRILRVARTIADLAGSESVLERHIAEAIGYRSLDRASYKENYYEDLTTLNYISPKIELRRSSLDRMIFPHSGTSLSLSGIYLYGRDRFVPSPYSRDEQRLRKSKRDVSWWGARIVWNQYFQISGSKWFSLGYGAEAVVTTIPTLSNDKVTRMLMPAYRPTLHSQTVYMPEYRAKRYAAVSVMPTFDFSDRFFLRTGIYAMFAERFRPTDDRMRYIVDASLVYHTGIGPISLSLTKYNVKNWDNLFLTFNFGYAMFRPRGIHY